MTMGKVICVGLGPGDPELMSVRADRLIRTARDVAYFRKAGRPGQARQIVEGMLDARAVEHSMEYPVTTEIPVADPEYNRLLAGFYDDWATRLATMAGDRDVVVLCEGDPFFYGSFMHLHSRLQGRARIEIVPAITGMSGCWTATGQPITWGDDVLTVLMATLPEDDLARRAADTDALVVMKIGRNLPKLKRALARAGRLQDAWLVERGTMPGQKVQPLCGVEAPVPYFTIAVVHGNGRRP
ncbi:MAG: precorrin-2 C(20)-methyltransferase [Confluentimicrobium sp.]|jgi:precorrin-2/cobalt-factor-2 C20-methyltransferase|uniref:precorrin-2 C(20)-methyltransferase n=1 Tax=Actibacterium sp. TaxID=1872125 RepID=UPI000C561ED7|nr:precorrin-2 C(20)-methyltransferase [Actibacterium sp.]MBC56673.1 precorrin-2 C(20)-methyltransferase [Actibacterium sp.]|tara:strand:+ start:1095 stop:1817 length:723 start_codon:yes stop_codon:yes gene_type:complete